MANLVVMSMRRLLGGGRKYCNMAATATRFHPDTGGETIIISGGESPVPEGKSPLPLLIVPPEMASDIGGDATNSHYNFTRIEKQHGDDGGIHKKLFLVKKKISNSNLPWEKVLLPDDVICRGSSHGWLAFEHPSTREVGLFNPFLLPNNTVSFPYIPLPRTETILSYTCRQVYKEDNLSNCPSLIREVNDCSLVKLALSSAPLVGGGDCNVVGISESTKELVFCRLGDSAWTNLIGSYPAYSDVTYFSKHGCFYALEKDHHDLYDDKPFHIESWDFTDPCCPKNTLIKPSVGSTPTTKGFPLNPQGWRVKETCFDKDCKVNSSCIINKYLVEVSGELLLVLRSVAERVDQDGFLIERSSQEYHDIFERDWNYHYKEISYGITVGFMVYKMDWSENKWEPVESLDDKALFLGLNHSFSVSTHDLPQVMQNSIYFTDDIDPILNSHGNDSGVYNMEDGFIFGILPPSLEEVDQPPLWVLPNPN